jgi:hypothetical protein
MQPIAAMLCVSAAEMRTPDRQMPVGSSGLSMREGKKPFT